MNKPFWMSINDWASFVEHNADDNGVLSCINCGERDDMTIDHIRARVEGGNDHLSNLQPLCRSCNSSKGARTDSYWGRHHYFDSPLNQGKLRVSQNDFICAPVIENDELFSLPWSNINQKLFLYAQIVGAGKTLGMFVLPFALNQIAGIGNSRVDKMLIITKDRTLRKQIARELSHEPVDFGIVTEGPKVIELTNGGALLNPPDHDIAIMCPNMLWPMRDGMNLDENGIADTTTVEWTAHTKHIVSQYQLVVFDEVHYAYQNVSSFIKVATRSLVFGFTASPVDGAGDLLDEMVLMSTYGYSDACINDNSMKWLGNLEEV